MKKYEFTGKILQMGHRTLKQIRRISDGLIGGYIESEKNLSHDGHCYVYDNARVFDNARVYGDAIVFDNARVYDNARVFDNARVHGDACVFYNARVYGDARVSGNAKATTLAQTIITHRHSITVTDDCVIIGCQAHSIKYWKQNIVQIGRDNGYTDLEIKAVKHLLTGLLLIRKKYAEKYEKRGKLK